MNATDENLHMVTRERGKYINASCRKINSSTEPRKRGSRIWGGIEGEGRRLGGRDGIGQMREVKTRSGFVEVTRTKNFSPHDIAIWGRFER